MQKLEIDVPDELAALLRPYQARLGEVLLVGLQHLHVREALAEYERGQISFGRAVERSGIGRDELIHQARAAGLEPLWSERMAAEELA